MVKTYGEAFPNIAAGSSIISVATVAFTYPQVVTVSNGRLPKATWGNTAKVISKTMPFQIPVKFMQFSCMRGLKHKLDSISPATSGLNTMISYGTTGVPFQSVMYNQCISDIYKFHSASAPSVGGNTFIEKSKALFWTKVYPGIAWCFVRESCATGGALVLGPLIRPKVEEVVGSDYPTLLKFGTGLLAGFVTAFLTQWIHNTALTAGAMAEMGEKATTAASFKRAITELGPSIVYKNYGRRMTLIAIASATLNTIPLFE